MKRLSRFAVALLMLNLSLTGSAVVCAHERPEAAASAASHDHARTSDQAPPPSHDESRPCDESGTLCCEAIASCAVSGVPERASSRLERAIFPETVFAGIDLRPDSAAPEVATPPPRRA